MRVMGMKYSVTIRNSWNVICIHSFIHIHIVTCVKTKMKLQQSTKDPAKQTDIRCLPTLTSDDISHMHQHNTTVLCTPIVFNTAFYELFCFASNSLFVFCVNVLFHILSAFLYIWLSLYFILPVLTRRPARLVAVPHRQAANYLYIFITDITSITSTCTPRWPLRHRPPPPR